MLIEFEVSSWFTPDASWNPLDGYDVYYVRHSRNLICADRGLEVWRIRSRDPLGFLIYSLFHPCIERVRRIDMLVKIERTFTEKRASAESGELMKLADAARLMFGASDARALVRVSRLIESGKLTEYKDKSEKNPRRARRVSRIEVERLLMHNSEDRNEY